MVNLNDNQTYKAILESLLKALAKHPDFIEIKEMVDKQMPANAANRVKEILAGQTALHESITSQVFDPDTGFWLAPTEGIQRQQVSKDDDVYFILPSLGDSDDSDFHVETYE